MAVSTPPQILDVTIRDGSNLINHHFSPEHIRQIVGGLGKTSLQYAEVSHGLGIGARMLGQPGQMDDDEMLEIAKEVAPNLNLSVLINSTEYSLPLIPGLADLISMGRVIYSPQNSGLTEKIIQKLKKYNKLASCQLVQAHLFDPEEIEKFSKQVESMGADLIYLVDTFGSFSLENVSEYMQAIRSSCKLPIGFHAHNNLGMALPNTLLAWKLGASWLDASVLGVGRGAGNTVLESLIVALEQEGGSSQISVEKICQLAQPYVLSIFNHPPSAELLDIMIARHKINFEPPSFLKLISTLLYLHLDDLFLLLEKKMKLPGTLTQETLFEILKEAGYHIDPLMESFSK